MPTPNDLDLHAADRAALPPRPWLVMERIGKRFGATRALHNVTLSVTAGEALALIGENGAGKSTLMKILSGAHAPDQGTMLLGGHNYAPRGPHEARRAGVAMIYQELNLAPDLSVEDNMMLGQEVGRGGWLRRPSQRLKVVEALKLLGHAELNTQQLVGSLSIATQQIVEIARALISDARVIIFDEPTSSLPKQDVGRLFTIIDRLQQQGIAIIYISHFLEEIRHVAKHFVVLRDGEPAGAGKLSDASDQEIIALMAGRSVQTLFPTVPHALGPTVLNVQQLSGIARPRRISLVVRQGEIFGLFGLIGAGRTETLQLLFGLASASGGQVLLHDRRLRLYPKSCIRSGLGFVSEDRKAEGLAQIMSINDNLTLSNLRPYTRWGWLWRGRRRRVVEHWMARLRIRARDAEQMVCELSGGNQQKVAIARVLHQQANVLLLDEPTRGIDVRTKAEIYQLIGEMAEAGKSIIWVSSYLPELLAICDTIGVMSRGELREVRPAQAWTEHSILEAAIAADASET